MSRTPDSRGSSWNGTSYSGGGGRPRGRPRFFLAGFAVAAGRWWLGVVVGLYFLLVFLPVLRREEREREATAPADYATYRSQVPALLPYRGRYGAAPAARFDWQVFRANREWRAEVGCALLLGLLAA